MRFARPVHQGEDTRLLLTYYFTMRLFISFFTFVILAITPYRSSEDIFIPPSKNNAYNGLILYKERLAFMESGCNPDTVNPYGYVGLYQIGRQAARDVNIDYYSLRDSSVNDTAMVRLMRKNWKYLSDCHDFVGDTINGVKITKAGMLAAAHLRGWAYVRAYLRTNGRVNGYDRNFITVESRLKAFQDIHEINF